MILSNVEIHNAIDEGRIIIEPEPRPRLPDVKGAHCPYNTHSVDVTLGDTVIVPIAGVSMDLSGQLPITDVIKRNSKSETISAERPFNLKPHCFVLANVREFLSLPIHKDPDRSLAARIEGKSSRARCGVVIHCTAPTVHPGYEGNLTLEISNLGLWPFILTPGMDIAQLIFEEVRGIPVRNDSQFQGHRDPIGRGQ